jgi:hypothetical protein
VSIAFLAIGLATVGLGGRMALTGKNVTGLLGRGLSRADDARLQRAPTAYFRAMGSMLLSLGLLVAWIGAFFLTIAEGPDDTYFAAMLSLAALLVVALIASAVWITILARRHRLFRWNKP